MTAEQFAYWLQGFAELQDVPPTEAQWQSIREHLQAVFQKVTPARQFGAIGQLSGAADPRARLIC